MDISEIEAELDASMIRTIQGQVEDALVTYWTCVVTIVKSDGTEMLLTLDRPNQELWQSMGLMDMTREMRRALIAQNVARDE